MAAAAEEHWPTTSEARLFLKEPCQSLAEHGVIVQQKKANC